MYIFRSNKFLTHCKLHLKYHISLKVDFTHLQELYLIKKLPLEGNGAVPVLGTFGAAVVLASLIPAPPLALEVEA